MKCQLSKKPPRATPKTRRGSCFGSRVPTVKRSLFPVVDTYNIPTRIRPSKKPPRFPERAFLTDVSAFPLAQLTLWPRSCKIASKVHLGETKWFNRFHEQVFCSKNLLMACRTHGEILASPTLPSSFVWRIVVRNVILAIWRPESDR